MLKNYYVEYYTNDGRRVGQNISAYTALDAKLHAESLPNYRNMANYPKEV